MIQKPKRITSEPGVYIFRRGKTPLYIGKALDIKKRLSSYFRNHSSLPAKIQQMLGEATRVETIETASEIEAFLKEAELIKRYRPKYNLLMRDDKNYFYVGITRDAFPRIFTTHQPFKERLGMRGWGLGRRRREQPLYPHPYPQAPQYIGPFVSGGSLQLTLKLLRRVFPYCTCRTPHARPCLNSQIGRCPGYCCMRETRKEKGVMRNKRLEAKQRTEYRKNIRSITAVLGGKRTRLISALRRQLKEASRHERYEIAARLRDQMFGLEDVFEHRMAIERHGMAARWDAIMPKLAGLLGIDRVVHRIEGYDIANIGPDAATGSMVVFTDGRPEKSQYRKFRIQTVSGISDVAMHAEVLTRRLRHPEWRFPDIMVIDGGKPQLSAALKVIQDLRLQIQDLRRTAVTALAKREEILFTETGETIYLKREDPALLHLFQRIRDESHRFARVYHHELRRRSYAEAK